MLLLAILTVDALYNFYIKARGSEYHGCKMISHILTALLTVDVMDTQALVVTVVVDVVVNVHGVPGKHNEYRASQPCRRPCYRIIIQSIC